MALRFAYITDTHLGCDDAGYKLQRRYIGQERALFDGLGHWLKLKDAAFLIHGGDLTDHGSPDEIALAVELCAKLELPVYLCLGNHDLAQRDSIHYWRDMASELLPTGDACFAVDAGAARVIVAGHHWHEDVDFHWRIDKPQTPRLSASQLETLDSLLDQDSRPVIAVTHAPLNDVPSRQRGDDEPFHPPYEPYLANWQRLAQEHEHLRLVLAGHNHAHSHHVFGSPYAFTACTTAAFNEIPAQARLITIHDNAIEVETFALASDLGLPTTLETGKEWSAGRAGDHRVWMAT